MLPPLPFPLLYHWIAIMLPGCFANLDLSPNAIEQKRQQVLSAPDYIDLTSSNPTHQGLLFPPEVLRAAATPYWETRRYTPSPHGALEARAAIAHFYATRTPPLALPPDALYLTASTSEAYGLLLALLADAGDNVLVPGVGYPLIDYLAAIHHIEMRPYQMVSEAGRGWAIDEESLAAQADARTRAVLIISPHNPTGAIVSAPLPVLDHLRLPLLCDEVFSAFPYRIVAAPPLATLHPDLPVFHLHGISKLFALPDLKLGWIALNPAAQAAYGPRLELLNDTFLGASGLIQTMLPTLFAQGMDFVATMAGRVRANLDMALEQFARCPFIEAHAPDGGYYLFPTIHSPNTPARSTIPPDEETLVLTLLDQQHVLVHPGYFFGDLAESHILLSALLEPERFARGVARICAAFT